METLAEHYVPLASAISYAVNNVKCVRSGHLDRVTPCAEWPLAELLHHMNDSAAAIHEGITSGNVHLGSFEPATGDSVADFVRWADRLVAALRSHHAGPAISIAGRHIDNGRMAIVGTVEFAVHGWDVSVTCGVRSSMPIVVGHYLLRMLPLVVNDGVRGGRFDSPVAVPPSAGLTDRVVGWLGRDPRWSH